MNPHISSFLTFLHSNALSKGQFDYCIPQLVLSDLKAGLVTDEYKKSDNKDNKPLIKEGRFWIEHSQGRKHTKEDAKTVMIQILNVVAFFISKVSYTEISNPRILFVPFKEGTSRLKAIYFGFSDYVRPSSLSTLTLSPPRLADAESSTKDMLLLSVDRSDKVTCTKLQSFIEELKQPIYFTTMWSSPS
ncbi:hypothetical protein F2Q68_00020484 [Brassica cretica]|uniref:Uncharacterized protein n=1 Tax=Brassica cretica TaxID=69181 RepID=A0A8S9G4C9_BRACR|nr:hypothetical protein F2Q68_00020484 [Brassica cretica]